MAGHLTENATSLLRTVVERCLANSPRRPLVLGVSGAQGSGKSTIARELSQQLSKDGKRAAQLSLDDFYLSRAARRDLAARLHPLFVTRGPPGTHDIAAALALIKKIKSGEAALAPQFDKARDEPRARDRAKEIPADLQVFIFEGWCLGAEPESEAALAAPVNMLEEVYDAEGVWRGAVNDMLGGAYQALFAEIEYLAYLRAPNFEIVSRWRCEQEQALADDAALGQRPLLMRPDEVTFFVQHFERITRSMMRDVPARAAVTFQLDESRRVTQVIRPTRAG
ncbi:MAG: kinase [Pseudomonadota bacterium]